MGLQKRAVAWVKDDPFGVEFAEIELARSDLSARGVAIAGGPVSYRLDYTLQTAADFVSGCGSITVAESPLSTRETQDFACRATTVIVSRRLRRAG